MSKPDFTPDVYSMKMKIRRLEEQLAKANETIESLHNAAKAEFDKREALDDELAKANERVKELEAKEQLTTLTTHEATLNSDYGERWQSKFALDSRCEAITAFTDAFIEANYKHDVPTVGHAYNERMREVILNALKKSAEKTVAQLRKEQQND